VGRIGTEGRRRLDPHPDPGAAINAWPAWPGRSAAAAIGTAPLERPVSPETPRASTAHAAGLLVLESLKKRRRGVYRALPVPPALLAALDLCMASASCRGGGQGRGHPPLGRGAA
jgi:hypothetical protein